MCTCHNIHSCSGWLWLAVADCGWLWLALADNNDNNTTTANNNNNDVAVAGSVLLWPSLAGSAWLQNAPTLARLRYRGTKDEVRKSRFLTRKAGRKKEMNHWHGEGGPRKGIQSRDR